MKTQVIIVAAGSGKRFGASIPKALTLLSGMPLVTYSLKIFEHCKAVNGIIVVGHKGHLPRFTALCRGFKKVHAVVPGGATRAASVKCGLAAVDADTDIVLVHDAARPLANVAMVNRLIAALRNNKAAIAAVPVKATVKKVDPRSLAVTETLQRNLLWEVQTPQGFHKDVLVKAHACPFKGEATDDAMLVERLGVKVKVVMGDHRNIKVTTQEDMVMAKGLM